MIAAADQVTICNQALAMLGKKPLTDFSDTGDVAKHCDALMPELIYELIEEYDWSFLRIGSAELSTTTAPTFGYTYAFTLPANVFYVIDVYDGDQKTEYAYAIKNVDASGTRVLETEQADDLYIKYIYTAEDELTNYRYTFWKIVRLRLAAILAVALEGNRTYAADLEAQAEKTLDKAIRQDVMHDDGEYTPYDRNTKAWHKAGR